MYYKKIVGKSVYLSPIDIDHEVDLMTLWMNEDKDIAYYNGFYGSLLGKEKVRALLEKWNEGPFMFSIINKENNAFMGHISMFNMGHHELYTTMGIYIGQEYRGNGYGKEAIQLVVDYLFQTQRYEAIQLQVFGYNKKAYEVYKKIGFKECGRYHKALYHESKYHDIILMELLKEDYYD